MRNKGVTTPNQEELTLNKLMLVTLQASIDVFILTSVRRQRFVCGCLQGTYTFPLYIKRPFCTFFTVLCHWRP